MRIAVVGSRRYQRLDEVRQFVFEQERDTVIISGGAMGVDTAAVDTARSLNMPYELHLPDWNAHGKSAGVLRNQTIVDASDEVVAFWDGQSRGTKHTIDYARLRRKPCRVIQETRG